MRGRGDLAGFNGTEDRGATATDSVAACIWGVVRRQLAIGITAFMVRRRKAAGLLLPNASRERCSTFWAEKCSI